MLHTEIKLAGLLKWEISAECQKFRGGLIIKKKSQLIISIQDTSCSLMSVKMHHCDKGHETTGVHLGISGQCMVARFVRFLSKVGYFDDFEFGHKLEFFVFSQWDGNLLRARLDLCVGNTVWQWKSIVLVKPYEEKHKISIKNRIQGLELNNAKWCVAQSTPAVATLCIRKGKRWTTWGLIFQQRGC